VNGAVALDSKGPPKLPAQLDGDRHGCTAGYEVGGASVRGTRSTLQVSVKIDPVCTPVQIQSLLTTYAVLWIVCSAPTFNREGCPQAEVQAANVLKVARRASQ
jgi:hypothetical protein